MIAEELYHFRNYTGLEVLVWKVANIIKVSEAFKLSC